jgi:hypothetical protein
LLELTEVFDLNEEKEEEEGEFRAFDRRMKSA